MKAKVMPEEAIPVCREVLKAFDAAEERVKFLEQKKNRRKNRRTEKNGFWMNLNSKRK